MCQEGQHHPPGKVLGQVFARFRDVRFEHDEDDALGKFLLIDEEIAEAGQGASPQHNANNRREHASAGGEEQHRGQPDCAHDEGLTEAGKARGAGQLDQQLSDAGKVPEEQKQPAQACPVEPFSRGGIAFKHPHTALQLITTWMVGAARRGQRVSAASRVEQHSSVEVSTRGCENFVAKWRAFTRHGRRVSVQVGG